MIKIKLIDYLGSSKNNSIILRVEKEPIASHNFCTITLQGSSQNDFILFEEWISDGLTSLAISLQEVLNYSLLWPIDNQDIGLVLNNYMAALDVPGDPPILEDITDSFRVWSSSEKNETWLYNQDNKIYLEVTPDYPKRFSQLEYDEKEARYKEFLKTYKPIFKEELPYDQAQQMLKCVNNILEKIEGNPCGCLHSIE